jgi:hypothetical protein
MLLSAASVLLVVQQSLEVPEWLMNYPVYIHIYTYTHTHTHTHTHTWCPTTYQTRHFFHNSKTNEDNATRFEQKYVRCVGNVTS